MKIRPVGAEFIRADGQSVRHDEAVSRFFEVFAKRLKICVLPKGCIYVFCTAVRTNRSYFHIQLGMTGFCVTARLLRGTNRIFVILVNFNL
jgi:hypothetical protein